MSSTPKQAFEYFDSQIMDNCLLMAQFEIDAITQGFTTNLIDDHILIKKDRESYNIYITNNIGIVIESNI